MVLREDEGRRETENGAHNFPSLRRTALDLLRREHMGPRGIWGKRLNIAWDDNRYLRNVLSQPDAVDLVCSDPDLTGYKGCV